MNVGGWLAAAAIVPVAGYALQFVAYRRAWQRLSGSALASSATSADVDALRSGPQVAVLVAARNEAATLPRLLSDLDRQMTQPGCPTFEVIVVDDHSTDSTAAAVHAFAQHSSFALQLLQLAALPGEPTGKKAAIETALATAQAPWVVCTDADCRVPPGWLASYAEYFTNPEVQFISGPVLLRGRGLLAALQGLELAALVGTGAASIGRGAPTMCNGANLAYRRHAFAEVGGFGGNAHIPSGDDEFLLHKIAERYPGGVRFLESAQATVRTDAQPTLRALLQQRVRWASKWRHYQSPASRRLALLVLAANVVLWLLLGLLTCQLALWPWAAAGWALKLGADVAFLVPVLRFFGRLRWLWLVPLLQLVYPPYALAVGLLGLRGGYRWKGRLVVQKPQKKLVP